MIASHWVLAGRLGPARRSPWPAIALLACATLALAGCPRHTRRTIEPALPTTGDARARDRFIDARNKFQRDGSSGAEFARIVEDFPNDPIAPHAGLYAGIAEIKARAFADADKHLAPVADSPDEALALRGALFLGIAKNYEGDAAAARTQLGRVQAAEKRGIGVVHDDFERGEYVAAVAYSTAAGEHPLASLGWFDELWRLATPVERALIVERVEQIVSGADADTLRRAWDELAMRDGPSAALVGSRLVIAADAVGDARTANQLRDPVAKARANIGLPKTIAAVAVPGGAAGLVGVALPFGTKQNRLAEASAQGLAIAAGATGGPGVVALEMRGGADDAVADLAGKNVVAIVGPIDKKSVDAAVARAEQLQVPLISLSRYPEQRPTGRYVFHICHSPEARVRTLARAALAKGLRTFAILRVDDTKDSKYGTAMARVFRTTIEKGGGTIVAEVGYADGTKSFGGEASKVARASFDALFVPADVEDLELIAPALATAGLDAKPAGTPKKKAKLGRPFVLISTAEGLSSAFLSSAARHAEGALLAPGFYPDDRPIAKAFVDRYRAAFAREPSAEAAYAYDAALLAASAGGGGRAALPQLVATGQLAGVTGTIEFDADHRRKDDALVYTVKEIAPGQLAIRVAE
jgi:ABC-type branched-subunit amino acid transport system substrate-binding protein